MIKSLTITYAMTGQASISHLNIISVRDGVRTIKSQEMRRSKATRQWQQQNPTHENQQKSHHEWENIYYVTTKLFTISLVAQLGLFGICSALFADGRPAALEHLDCKRLKPRERRSPTSFTPVDDPLSVF